MMFTHMPEKKGIQHYGEKAIAAIVKECRQMNDSVMPGKHVLCPINPTELTREEKCKAMDAVTLINHKHDGKIKGRTCADGRKQRHSMDEFTNVASPTVSVDALFSTLVVYAMEERDVAIFDVKGAFLQPEMPKGSETVLLKLKDMFVDIMCSVNPEYEKTLIYEKG